MRKNNNFVVPSRKKMSSSFFPSAVFFSVLLILFRGSNGKNREAEDFLRICPISHCGSGSLEIRFPFRLNTSPPSCGLEGLELTCSGDDPLLALPSSPHPFKVTDINYLEQLLTIGSGSEPVCPPHNLAHLESRHFVTRSTVVSLAICSTKFVPDPESSRIAGPVPIPCRNEEDGYMYAAAVDGYASSLPRGCMVVATDAEIPVLFGDGYRNALGDTVELFMERREFRLSWWSPADAFARCRDCELLGQPCGFSWSRDESFCISRRRGPFAVIIGTSIGGLVIFLSVSLAALCAYRQLEKRKEIGLQVERFLAMYNSKKPARYTYSDIKKMTKQFKHKLGEGGFASVFKGELPTGIPVAVKILKNSKGDGVDFINEVGTMGRIHHVNVIRLLGFCSEGTKYALIYEFMPNESLEKFIFSKEAKKFSIEKMQEIAVGIARGIEYLHQGCDQRILHFDIKPHNILLDEHFNPKVSDFGLAKLCSRDASIVTMTAARGTMGYVAPEIYLRNFGTVSYKSDVYSFGMLLLEMVSGRRNVDPTIEAQSQIYFPEWAYERLVDAGDLGLATEEGKEVDLVKKLVIVALWCIQLCPTDRPSMTRVIQMMTGDLENLQLSPKPFLSSHQEIEEILVRQS